MTTKIEWLFKMAFPMATNAQWDNIQPMRSTIAAVMMVVTCLSAAINTREFCSFHHSATLNLITNSTRGLRLNLCRWWSIDVPFSVFGTSALLAVSSKSTSTTAIEIESCYRFPRFACGTPLQAAIYLFKVFFNRYTYTFSRDLLNSLERTHVLVSIISGGYYYTHSIKGKQLGGYPDKHGDDKALLDGRLWRELPGPLRKYWEEEEKPVQGRLF